MPTSLELSTHLFLQLATILIVCRAVAYVLRPLGQTLVVGEMVAGVLLGPSFLGLIAPSVKAWLFPSTLQLAVGGSTVSVTHPSMMILYTLGQLGLVLYMFVIGLEFNTKLISQNLKHAGLISGFGIAVPLLVGGALGYAFEGKPGLFGPGLGPGQAALFLAAAMAVTAFPVLARIISDLGLTRTGIGTLTLGAAASNDVAAWCLLAILLATASGSPAVAALAIGGGLAYAAFMVLVGRHLFARFDLMFPPTRPLPPGALVAVMLILILCAAFTDNIGIHSIFGAFILGAVMPRGHFTDEIQRSIERFTMTLLVPVFFAFSGLNTRVGLLADPSLLRVAGLIILAAFLAKGGACFLASWLNGSSVRVAASVGSLMNARGLMELILINIGLDRGLITPAMFTILVLMTITTTMAAAPLFRLFYRAASDSPRISAAYSSESSWGR